MNPLWLRFILRSLHLAPDEGPEEGLDSIRRSKRLEIYHSTNMGDLAKYKKERTPHRRLATVSINAVGTIISETQVRLRT